MKIQLYSVTRNETHFGFKDTHGLKKKRWKNIFHTNSNQKRKGVAVLNITQSRLLM